VSADTGRALLFLSDEERADRDFPQGTVCVRSRKSPEKATPNEDAAAVIPVGRQGLVLAVADGVGGTPAGREASHQAMRCLSEALALDDVEVDRLRTAILDAFDHANREILALGRGAATTLVAAEIVSGQMRSYHVGDSELIAVGQRGMIKSRVVPHSPTGFAVEAGLLDEDEAVRHDQRHILFNVIGAQDMRVEMGGSLKLATRDTVLLASDGLLDNLFVDEIVETVRKGPLAKAADRLMEMASARMRDSDSKKPSKPDDLTIVLYRPRAPKRKPRS
jgi:serine/threonine protein phosphatase PrpC